MIVMMMDRVLKLLDKPGMSAVVMGSVDWTGAFDREDPTITIIKMIRMGVRSSIIPIIMQFLKDRKIKIILTRQHPGGWFPTRFVERTELLHSWQ